MLFWWALFVEIVPGNWLELKNIPSDTLPENVLPVTVLRWAPRVESVVPPKPVRARPERPLFANWLPLTDESAGPPCSPSNPLSLNVLLEIVASSNDFRPMLAPVPFPSKRLPSTSGDLAPLIATLRLPSENSPVPVAPLTMLLLVRWKPSNAS